MRQSGPTAPPHLRERHVPGDPEVLPEDHLDPGLEHVPAEFWLALHLELQGLRGDAVEHQVRLVARLLHRRGGQNLTRRGKKRANKIYSSRHHFS